MQPLISKVQYCLLEMIVSAIAFLATDDWLVTCNQQDVSQRTCSFIARINLHFENDQNLQNRLNILFSVRPDE